MGLCFHYHGGECSGERGWVDGAGGLEVDCWGWGGNKFGVIYVSNNRLLSLRSNWVRIARLLGLKGSGGWAQKKDRVVGYTLHVLIGKRETGTLIKDRRKSRVWWQVFEELLLCFASIISSDDDHHNGGLSFKASKVLPSQSTVQPLDLTKHCLCS